MKKIILAAAAVALTAGSAFAQSSALDAASAFVVDPSKTVISTTSFDSGRDRLGDGSPMYQNAPASGIDYTATASVGTDEGAMRDRLGDGSPRY